MTHNRSNVAKAQMGERTSRGEAPARTVLAGASLLVVATFALAAPASAQVAICPQPGAGSGGGGRTASQRLRDPDPQVREMARADLLADQDQRDQARAIYQRLAQARSDRRETARRANLRLARLAAADKNFAEAEGLVRKATGPGASADLRERGREMLETIAYRREVASAEAGLDSVDALAAAGQLDEATRAAQALAQRACPYPPDFPARVKSRLAQIYRARGDFQSARATALDAQRMAATPTISQGTTRLIAEIDAAALAAELRAQIASANESIAAGNSGAAIAILQPLLARPDLPAEIEPTVRLRLARAYAEAGQYDAAVATIEPLRSRGGLDAEGYAAAARIHLARANDLQQRGNHAAADPAYRELLAWNPAVELEVRDSARLGLARALDRRGQRRAAMEQVALVRSDAATPDLRQRAIALQADISGDIPPGRLVGYLEAGIAHDTNVPTIVSAQDENDDELSFPANQRFSDTHIGVAGRLQYRQPFGGGDNTFDLSLSGLRTFQFDLTSLDRTRLELSAGPSFGTGDGLTRFLVGGNYSVEWRGGNFRASEPGIYAGVRTDLGANLSVTAVYTLGFHNDYRPERDGTDHEFDAQFRYDAGGDVVRFDLRATREGGNVDIFRNWRLRAGADWTHRWESGGRMAPFITVGGSAERVIYDGLTTGGIARRDWKLRAEAEAGVELDRRWRASLHYGFYDIDSNVLDRNRRPDHQVGLTVRYSWN